MAENSELLEKINKMQVNLDNAYREMADGVREFLDLRQSFKNLLEERNCLEAAAVKALMASSSMTKEHAQNMLNEWCKTVTKSHTK